MMKFRQFHVYVCATFLTLCAPAVLTAQIFDAPAPQPNAAVQQAGGQVGMPQTGEVKQTAWSGIPLPKITMPKLTMPKLTMPKVTMPSMTSVTGPVKSGFGKVSAGTKKAWEGTKEIFTFGQQKPAPTTTQNRPSWWRRMITPAPEPDGPQTVAEWMAQPRLDP